MNIRSAFERLDVTKSFMIGALFFFLGTGLITLINGKSLIGFPLPFASYSLGGCPAVIGGDCSSYHFSFLYGIIDLVIVLGLGVASSKLLRMTGKSDVFNRYFKLGWKRSSLTVLLTAIAGILLNPLLNLKAAGFPLPVGGLTGSSLMVYSGGSQLTAVQTAGATSIFGITYLAVNLIFWYLITVAVFAAYSKIEVKG